MKIGCFMVVLVLLLSSVTLAVGVEQKWFRIGRNQEYVTDFALTPQEEKVVKVPATQKEFILFRSDTDGLTQETLQNGPYPIRMTDLSSRKSIDSFYSGLDLKPKNGEIQLSFKNLGDRTYRLVVLKMKKQPAPAPAGQTKKTNK